MDINQIQWFAWWAMETIAQWAPTVVGAVVTLLVWMWIIKRITKLVRNWFEKSKMDKTVSKFLSSLVNGVLKVMLVITVAGMFGIETTSFIAILWAAWLAIGLALQGSLANFAWGVLILVFKPYKVGDLIETQWVLWSVDEIGIFTTVLHTPEQKTAIIPNGPLANGNIINYTKKWEMRVDVLVWVWYNADLKKTKEILNTVVTDNKHTLTGHAWQWVFVNGLWDSSVDLIVRWFSTPENYWDAFFSLTEQSKLALDAASIDIPYPHRVVTMIKE